MRRNAASIAALFFLSGFGLALWGVHIPLLKARFALGDAALSWLLFAVAAGAIAAMSSIGRLVRSFGSARVCVASGVMFAGALALLWRASDTVPLVLVLFALGFANGSLDVAMNAQAVVLETRSTRPVMSKLHGMFSLGGIAGAAIGGDALARETAPATTFLGCAAFAVLLLLAAHRTLLTDAASSTSAMRPAADRVAGRKTLRALGALAFLGMLVEGAMYDWSTVYMHEVVDAPRAWLGGGYACFSAGMTAARFLGDGLRARFGGGRLLQASALLCAAAIASWCVWPQPVPALCAATLIGFGCANLVPVLFAEAAAVGTSDVAAAIAVVGRAAYVGILIGPVLIGRIAAHAGLVAAFWALAACCGCIAVGARHTVRWTAS